MIRIIIIAAVMCLIMLIIKIIYPHRGFNFYFNTMKLIVILIMSIVVIVSIIKAVITA